MRGFRGREPYEDRSDLRRYRKPVPVPREVQRALEGRDDEEAMLLRLEARWGAAEDWGSTWERRCPDHSRQG